MYLFITRNTIVISIADALKKEYTKEAFKFTDLYVSSGYAFIT